jgi:hypothetical protein
MPTASDLVTDLPADFETFGQAVATSMADLLGGTTGQVLSKASNTDMDFTWVAQDDSNAIQNAIVDAKGDLIAASAADTPARLAVGSNGTSLVADSTTSTGLKWGYAADLGVNLANSGFQTINNVTETTLSWDTEFWDVGGFHSTTTNISRITIPTGLGGKYLFNGNFAYPSNATGQRYAAFKVNGSGPFYIASTGANGTYSSFLNFSIIASANAGDYFEFITFQNSGSTLSLLTDTRLLMTYLGA